MMGVERMMGGGARARVRSRAGRHIEQGGALLCNDEYGLYYHVCVCVLRCHSRHVLRPACVDVVPERLTQSTRTHGIAAHSHADCKLQIPHNDNHCQAHTQSTLRLHLLVHACNSYRQNGGAGLHAGRVAKLFRRRVTSTSEHAPTDPLLPPPPPHTHTHHTRAHGGVKLFSQEHVENALCVCVYVCVRPVTARTPSFDSGTLEECATPCARTRKLFTRSMLEISAATVVARALLRRAERVLHKNARTSARNTTTVSQAMTTTMVATTTKLINAIATCATTPRTLVSSTSIAKQRLNIRTAKPPIASLPVLNTAGMRSCHGGTSGLNLSGRTSATQSRKGRSNDTPRVTPPHGTDTRILNVHLGDNTAAVTIHAAQKRQNEVFNNNSTTNRNVGTESQHRLRTKPVIVGAAQQQL